MTATSTTSTNSTTARALNWVEQGYVPDRVVRLGIQRLLRQRLQSLGGGDVAAVAQLRDAFVEGLSAAPLAPLAHKANEQHYELPAAFFQAVLGAHRKYSCALWADGVETLDEAEAAALQVISERAELRDGQRILELGCGWGSWCLWMAARYPNAHITAVSNSVSQRQAIEALAQARGLQNLQVITADINTHVPMAGTYDRVVSVEMFEHLRNWPRAFERVALALKDDGRFFMHVFVHGGAPYAFVDEDDSDWMSRHFFSGGMMPSDDLALRCQDHLRVRRHWRWSGAHYQRTADAWLARMDAAQAQLRPLFDALYGDDAERWWMRWRLFFLSVSELFGYEGGARWWVSHYLFERRQLLAAR